MTDKQIIMDSSKCKHYWNGNCSDWDNTLIGACDDFEDCYCKMYLRKEQECEELTSKCSQLEESFKETADGLLKIQYALADHCNKYSKTLAEIKELLLKTPTDSQEHCINAKSVILQKINEVENE